MMGKALLRKALKCSREHGNKEKTIEGQLNG